MQHTNFLQYSDLENFLFNVVSIRYAENKTLSAFDFFCIVIWKANRAKSKVAKKLLAQGNGHANLNDAVEALFVAITNATNKKARLYILIQDWRFRLPMASAILTVLFPEEFTVYDIRVCGVLVDLEQDDFADSQYKTNFDTLWERYSGYVNAVKDAAPKYSSLRDKDRYLWGRSFAKQLESDIESKFIHKSKGSASQLILPSRALRAAH